MAEKKTEHLNLRLDPKLDFAVWFARKAAGKTKQEFAESAIRRAADDAADEKGRSWRKFWDPSVGVRELSLMRWGSFETDVDEDRRAEFVQAHAPFFFFDSAQQNIWRAAVDVLWDDIEALQREWFDTRRSDYLGVSRKMSERLKAAGLQPPEPKIDAEAVF